MAVARAPAPGGGPALLLSGACWGFWHDRVIVLGEAGVIADGAPAEVLDAQALARALPRNVFPLGSQEVVRRLAAPPQLPGVVSAYISIATDPVQGAVH